MAIEHYKKILWEPGIMKALKKATVFTNLTNSNVKITEGNVAKIISVSDVTISDYTPYSDMSFQTPQDTDQSFTIDQKKGFAVNVDSISEFQMISSSKLRTMLLDNAAYQVADTIDQYLAGKYGDAGIVGGSGESALGTAASPIEITADGGGSSVKASHLLGRLKRRLADGNVPLNNRKMMIPPWLMQKFWLEKLIGLQGMSNENDLSSGNPGTKLAGFKVWESNNVHTTSTTYHVMAGTPNAISYYQQMSKFKAGTFEKQFTDYFMGLVVYDAKVTKPAELACAYITEGSEGQ